MKPHVNRFSESLLCIYIFMGYYSHDDTVAEFVVRLIKVILIDQVWKSERKPLNLINQERFFSPTTS